MSWTTDPRQRPRTGWAAAVSAAVRRPRRWFPVRRLIWLACIAFAVFVIVGAGTHLGPGLSAAHGNGTPGLWTAQQPGSNGWTGEFVSTSGADVRQNVSYAGSLSNVQAGTVVPALDAGASDEVYPLTGSDKWVKDLIGVIAGSLALLALLGRGFYVARRRRRRGPDRDYLDQAVEQSDYLTQAATPRGRRLRRRPAAPQTRAGKLGLFAVGLAATGWITGKLCLLLADVRPYTGWYWLLAVAGGIVIAVGLPWAAIAGARRVARWSRWVLFVYLLALAGAMRYFLSLRFTPPSGVVPAVLPAPPPGLVAQMVGLSAEAFTFGAISLLLIVVMLEVIFPGPIGGWLRSRRQRKSAPPRHGHGLANTPDREP